MCLAIPGEILEIDGNSAKVELGGAERKVRLDLLEDVNEGDYVLIHVGYAIQVISPQEAEKMFDSWRKIAEARTNART